MAKFNMTGGIDAWLIHRGISHPVITPVVRNQLLAALATLFAATAAPDMKALLWFSLGFILITFILYSWARFFLCSPIGEFGPAFMRAFVFRFLLRCGLLAVALYFGLTYGELQPMPFLGGVAAGTFVPLLTIAWEWVTNKRIL